MKDIHIGNIVINENIIEEITNLQIRGYGVVYQDTCIELIEAITRADDYKTADDRMKLIQEILTMRDFFKSFTIKEGDNQ